MQDFSVILQSADSHVDVKDDSILVAQQGEQDAATATIMATVEQQEGKYLNVEQSTLSQDHVIFEGQNFGFCIKINKIYLISQMEVFCKEGDGKKICRDQTFRPEPDSNPCLCVYNCDDH